MRVTAGSEAEDAHDVPVAASGNRSVEDILHAMNIAALDSAEKVVLMAVALVNPEGTTIAQLRAALSTTMTHGVRHAILRAAVELNTYKNREYMKRAKRDGWLLHPDVPRSPWSVSLAGLQVVRALRRSIPGLD